ncbi:MAG: hypothetical protein R6T90_00300 [Dissulfuribacterales bacterium]
MKEEDLKASIEQNQRDIDSLKEVQEKLKKELEEAEKPKFRHGDYGYDCNGKPCLKMKVFRERGISSTHL